MAIPDMAARGQSKLARKAGTMAASWQAARGRMTAGYRAVGFGPTRTQNYDSGIAAATYRAPDPGKWARNWSANFLAPSKGNLEVITSQIRGKLNHIWQANPELSGESLNV